MTTFYDDSSQRVSVPMFYLKEHLPSSYQEAHVLPGNMMLYMNPSSCSDTLGIDSISQQQQEILSDYSGSRVAEQDINTLRGFQPLGGSSCGMLQNGLEGNPDLSITNSVYLKATQKLLDEVVNIRKALKQRPEDARDRTGDAADGVKDEDGDSADKGSSAGKELSHSERQELQKKLAKLFGMLDEVDKRYTQYYHQMQIVAWGLDAVAGPGAAKPYTSLALQRISRHFRCLKDAINGQISATRKGLGEQDSSSDNKGVRIARLRYVDQQLRQQKALQQLGMMQQPDAAWRPQRGLPESSVSILRAWLFEHFLHPYPKDSEKMVLARQTGLSRSQVSNWFINARVRLWKPMVEDMYKEEFGHTEKGHSVSMARDNYGMSGLGSFGHRTGMMHHGYAPVGGNDVFYGGASASSIGTGVTEVHAISDQEEQYHRLGPWQQQLSDFVAGADGLNHGEPKCAR